MFMAGHNVRKYVENAEEYQIQPNGVDLRIESLFEVVSDGKVMEFDGVNLKGFSYREVVAEDGYFRMDPNRVYVAVLKERVRIPDGYVGLYYSRSSLFRSGIMTMSSLFDTGFVGYPRVMLVNKNNVVYLLKRGSRIGQLTLVRSDYTFRYNGKYNES